MDSTYSVTRHPAPALTKASVHQLLVQTWGEQSCQNPKNWPDTLQRLLTGNANRYGFKIRVDEACELLQQAFAGELPDDPVAACWRSFPMLTSASCSILADRLIAARAEADRNV
jgi:hypothetical protein